MDTLRSPRLGTLVEAENWKKWANLNRFYWITTNIDGKKLAFFLTRYQPSFF